MVPFEEERHKKSGYNLCARIVLLSKHNISKDTGKKKFRTKSDCVYASYFDAVVE